MVEDYVILTKLHRPYEQGRDRTGRKIMGLQILYRTAGAGELSPEAWKKQTLAEIEKAGETELLQQLIDYCRKHCAWLHKEKELHEYAMECLVSRSYLYWTDFQKEIIWM